MVFQLMCIDCVFEIVWVCSCEDCQLFFDDCSVCFEVNQVVVCE